MRLFRRSRRVGADAPDAPPATTPEPAAPPRPHPDQSRARSDWAKLPPIELPTAAPPLTFDGARFGHTVAGGRSMVAAERPTRRHRAAGGVVMGLASGETIIPSAPVDDAGQVLRAESSIGYGAGEHHQTRLVAVHRRPTVVGMPHSELTTSDIDHPFTPVPIPGAVEPAAATSWSLDGGFGKSPEPEPDPEEPNVDVATRPTRVIHRRPFEDSRPADPSELDDTSLVSDDDLTLGPSIRYLPTSDGRDGRWTPTSDIPADIADAVRSATGGDVSDAEIVRSPATTEGARVIGAIAFTERGTVHLPAELGGLDDPGVRSIVAHELTHVAQQRVRGGDLPDEHTDEGRELERQARLVQSAVHDATVVVPTFLRRSESSGMAGPGVQRLTNPGGEDAHWADVETTELDSDGNQFAPQPRADPPADTGTEIGQDRSDLAQPESPRRELVHPRSEIDSEPTDPAGSPTTDQTSHRPDSPLPPVDTPPVAETTPTTQAEPDSQGTAMSPADDEARGLLAATPGRSPGTPPRRGLVRVLPVVSALDIAAMAGVTLLHRVVGTAPTQPGASAPLAPAATPTNDLVDDRPTTAMPAFDSGLGDLTARRLDRERELRRAVLTDKREMYLSAGRAGSVELSSDEVSQIRLLVDLELPSGQAFPTYLEDAEDTVLTAEDEFISLPASRVTGTLEIDAAPGSGVDESSSQSTDDAFDEFDGAEFTDVGGGRTADISDDTVADGVTVGSTIESVEEADSASGDPLAHPELEGSAFANAELASLVVDSMSEIDLEVLTRRLYRRLRTHIRQELLIDRERSGALADIR